MNITEFIAKVRLVLDDASDATLNPLPKFSDAEILDHGQEQARYMARVQVQRGKGFHNFTMALGATTGVGYTVTQIGTSVWQYALPPWVMAVAGVWQISSADSVLLKNGYSPYVWGTSQPLIGAEIMKWNRSLSMGYTFDGRRNLRLYGWNVAQQLLLNVAKLPPRWFRATIDQAHATDSKMYLPASLNFGTEDLTQGGYLNADIQVLSSSNYLHTGQVRRVVWDEPTDALAGARKHTLTLQDPFVTTSPLPVGAVVETLLPIADEHSRALILLTANACLEKVAAIPAQKSIAGELSQQLLDFGNYAAEIDSVAGPMFWQSSEKQKSYDPDRSTSYRPAS